MKKFSFILIALLTLCTGVLFSACTQTERASITLSATNVQILLGETENNSATITAKLENATASRLNLVYDASNISITQVANPNGTFTFTIKSLVEHSTNPISVQVKYGNSVSATFYVEVIIPIEKIVASENAYIAYNGQKTTCDLQNLITCLPTGTEQTDVEFSLAEENENYSITGNILTVNANIQNLTNIQTIKINAVSKVENKSSVRAELNVALVPNIKLLANAINVMVDYEANTSAPTTEQYKLNLTKNGESYNINTFEVKISFPSYLGLDVDVDSSLTPNILSFLSYERLYNVETINDVYTFKFKAKSSLQGAGGLRFKYSYKNYSNENSLVANFVCNTAEEEINKLDIVIVTPITSISAVTDCKINQATNQYAIYQSYSNNMGERFAFSTAPENTSQNTLKLTISEQDALLVQVRNSQNQIILGDPANGEQPILSAEIKASDLIYIKGLQTGQVPTITCQSLQNSDVACTLAFEIKEGATGLGFVPEIGSTELSNEVSLNVEVGAEVSATIFANGASREDIIFDANVQLNSVAGEGNEHYFVAKFRQQTAGVYTYIFSTANGYTATATINVIQPLTSAMLQLKSNPEHTEGIGDYFPKSTMQDLESISIQNGYSVELAYTPNAGAIVSKIEYSFYEEVVDVYNNDQMQAFKVDPQNRTFKRISSYLNTQNLSMGNIITGLSTGVSIVKIEIYGQKVSENSIVEEVKDTKYLFVQVYNPVKSIQASSKNIPLRVQSQVQTDNTNTSLFTKTISINALSDSGKLATYNKVFINRGKIVTKGTDLVCTYTRTSADNATKLFTLEYNYTTSQLTITALNLENNIGGTYSFSVFAGDFVTYEEDSLILESDVLKDIKKYTFSITLVETKAISEIYVSNLALKQETSTTKTYETIYIDTKDTNTFKIITNVQPADAFNKTLVYDYTPDSGTSQASVVIEDGVVRVVGQYGGTGVITIKPQHNPNNKIKTIQIPIVVADGNSWQTAYEITSLSQITQSNKHYVLSIPTTYVLNSSLFENSLNTFSGGLYGRRYADRNSSVAMATIRLNKVSLFNVLAQSAHVADLNICGDVSETGYTQNQVAVNFASRGFVANINNGTIENVNITSYVLNGIYVPSLLTVGAQAENVGGIVGVNKGTILNCKFAGSINVEQKPSVVASAIAGVNEGTINSCRVVIAKFDSSLAQSGRVVEQAENIYTNGIVGGTQSLGSCTNATTENFADYSFDGNVWINNYSEGELKHSYGKQNEQFGLVFYYKAQNATDQNNSNIQKVLATYNTIYLESMLGINSTTLTAGNLKVVALNTDNTPCDFVTVNSNSITLNDVGRFKLKISTEYDYTVSYEFNMLSLYYASNFTINSNGVTIDASSAPLELIGGQTHDISTKLNSLISVTLSNGLVSYLQLMQNDFQVLFTMTGVTPQPNASDYITSTALGSHTINITTSWTWYTATTVNATLVSGYGTSFDELINQVFATATAGTFSISRKNGTTNILANIMQGEIEPKDTFSFVATITTDVTADQITAESIKILNEHNIDITSSNYFNVSVEKVGEFKYRIYINVNFDTIGNMIDYVDKTYKIVVYAISDAGQLYDANLSVNMHLLPQTISDVSSSIYTITTQTTTGINVSSKEVPTSVLIPSGPGGVLVVDMFPAYASFDYLEIVANSNTMSKLSFRLLEKEASGVDYHNISTGYESIEGKNGIRIFNNQNNDIQNIGTYYIKLFTDATFDTDTIFNLSIVAYYKGEELPAKSVLTLYVRMPEAPVLSLDGETTIYSLAGRTIDGITALVSDDQVNPTAKILCLENGDSVVDRKPTNKISVGMQEVSQNAVVGYRRYKVIITFNSDYDISVDSTRFTLVVTSTKIVNGTEIPISAEMQINIVDYVVKDGDIVISNAPENTFRVTGLKYEELKIGELDNVLATENFMNFFNNNYYYNNQYTSFTFGSNSKTVGETSKQLDNNALVLASYLSFVEGNSKYPLLKINNNGEFELESNNYLTFKIEKRLVYDNNGNPKLDNEKQQYTYHLMVKGATHTGTTNMVLDIKYQLPDGRIYTYAYNFAIVHSLYTTEDLPREIANVDDFLGIANETDVQDYILTNDLYLYDFTTIENTSKMTSFDGNNYTINIMSFAESATATNFALFNSVSATTTIKNLTVNLYYLQEIPAQNALKTINVAGFAISNHGSIYNCEVVSYKTNALSGASATHGIKINSEITAEVAGFVLNNKGSITNSRVGGTQKLVTKYDYDNNTVISSTQAQTMLTIRASGNLYGFVGTNDGIISSSFAKNINIQNTYSKQDVKNTAGFVGENNKQIVMSYAEGAFEKEQDVQASLGGLEGSGILAGFVITNKGSISDCYSNLLLTNSRQQVGRLGAGFVYYNSQDSTIERSYSASKIVSNNVTQMNFVGITDFGGYNNDGQIKNSYYYIESSNDIVTIEGLLNSSIYSVSNVSDKKEFYGFNFASTNTPGTWAISENKRPQIVSADDIAHSLRAKYELEDNTNNLGYVFSYCEGYELGTASNPIIIRNAKEFNSVFGGSSSTDISANYNLTSKKVYGSYRLVNNINMLELVPEVEQQGDYKVNLISTTLTLTGENKKATNRDGSVNGNGLTISNLAISNSSRTSDSFGLFMSIEKGASICNLNIELAKGGVSADHTVFVGTVAGSLIDSYAYNISVTSRETNAYTQVIGANVSGGVFGRVIGNSNVANINVNNVSVVSTFYANYATEIIRSGINTYDRNNKVFGNISIAGGAFGVLDVYSEDNNNIFVGNNAEDALNASALTIAVSGGMKIQAMTAGGVVGYVGEYVSMRDVALTLTNTALPAVINSYNCYAGGIAGYSKGYIYQFRAEHQADWQQSIESNIHNYYTSSAQQRQTIDRGNINLFESSVSNYNPYAIGGIVGYQQGGKLSIGYSKINAINTNAYNIGGVIGYVGAYVREQEEDSGLMIVEVYAIGDVHSERAGAKIAGIIGDNQDTKTTLNKVNALNYWGYESIGAEGTGLVGISNGNECIGNSAVYSIREVKFAENDTATSVSGGSGEGIKSYFDYTGISSDNGAQIDLMFKQNQWYIDGNWSRDVSENYPHINYVSPQNKYIIETTADFIKFALYGFDKDATFIIKGGDDGMVDCTGWNTTLGAIKAQIVGVSGKHGFKNLNTNLFSSASGSSISNLRFENCEASLVRTSENVSYTNITYDKCNFKVGSNNNFGGVTINALGDCTFSGITFKDCSLATTNNVQNAGLLFAKTGENSNTGIDSITITNNSVKKVISITKNTNTSNQNAQGNFGLLFGSAYNVGVLNPDNSVTKPMSSIKISNTELVVNLTQEGSTNNDDPALNIHVGLVGGSVNQLALITSYCSFDNSSVIVDGKNDGINENITKTVNLYVGGLIGKVGGDATLLKSPQQTSAEQYLAPTITTKNLNCLNSQYYGGLFGHVNTINLTNNGLLILGINSEISTEFSKLEFSFAESKDAINHIGGIAGQAENIKSLDGSSKLAFFGDLFADGGAPNSKTYLNVGGIIGRANGNVNNVYYDGTISFNNDCCNSNLHVRVGGIVGYVENTTTITNAVASGEIIVPNSTNSTSTTRNFAGVVGANNGTLKIDNAVVLTTIFSTSSNSQQDVIVNNFTDSTLTLINTEYSSTLTLATSKHPANNKMLNKIMSKDTIISLANYSIVGSKLRPYTLTTIVQEVNKGYNFTNETETNETKNKYGYSVGDNSITLKSTYLRKMYVKLDDDELSKQISLVNTILFSDGEKAVYSHFTPIHSVDANSAVSSVVIKLFCQESLESACPVVSCAGLVNKNEGLIYLCSVQETLSKYQVVDVLTGTIIPTQFTATLYLVNKPDFLQVREQSAVAVAGFVAYNTGYIFGCNTNIAISLKDNASGIMASGFVGYNSGTISYCYASGSIDNTSGLSYLFAVQDNEATSSNNNGFGGKYDNSYSIVTLKHSTTMASLTTNGNQTNLPLNISNEMPSGVVAEQDAVQVQLKSSTNLFMVDKDGYGECDLNYNYGYPTLSGGVYKDLTFLKRCTLLSRDEKSNIEGKFDEITTIDNKSNYAQIPNLTLLKLIGANSANAHNFNTKYNNYVVISDITPNYTYSNNSNKSVRDYLTKPIIGTISKNLGESEPKVVDFNNKQFNYISLKDCNLITTVSEGVKLKNLQFGGYIRLVESSGIIGTVENNATIETVTVNTIDVSFDVINDSHVGILVATNNGTIKDVTFRGKIASSGSITISNTTSPVVGGVVGVNNGIVSNGRFAGTAIIDEYEKINKGQNLIFGAFIGKNSGTSDQLQLTTSSTNSFALISDTYSSGEGLYGGQVVAGKNSLASSDVSAYYKSSIYVRTGAIATVGGIVGVNEGTISKCATKNKDFDTEYDSSGKEKRYSTILVGDEFYQMVAYAGGIVGYQQGGTIQDCANLANVTAMSTWLFVSNKQTNAEYTVNGDGTVVSFNQKTGSGMGTDVYVEDASDASSNPMAYFDSNSGCIFVYREMWSMAYAGGIAGKGISTVATEPNAENATARLLNYGTIRAGYRSIKPVLRIEAEQSKIIDATLIIAGASVAAMLGSLVLVNAVPVVGWATFGVVAIGSIVSSIIVNDINKSKIEAPTFYTTAFTGNSISYHMSKLGGSKENKINRYIKKMFNIDLTQDGVDDMNDYDVDVINKALGYVENFNGNYTKENNYLSNLSQFVFSDLDILRNYVSFNSIAIENPSTKIDENSFIQDYSSKESEVHTFKIDPKSTSITIPSFLNAYNSDGVDAFIPTYTSDGICPDIKGKGLQVYSAQTNLIKNSDGSSSLRSGNPQSEKIKYLDSLVKDKYDYENFEISYIPVGEGNIPTWREWNLINGYYTPYDSSSLILGESTNTDDVNSIVKADGKLTFTLTNPNNWEKVVYTINHYVSQYEREIEAATNEDDKINIQKELDAWLTMTINVDTGTLNEIPIQRDTLNKFNGTINFKNVDNYFTNLILSDSNSNTNVGLIGQTDGCILNGVNVKGSADVVISKTTESSNVSVGLLIGQANGKVVIKNCAVQTDEININGSSCSNITNFGAFVGSVGANDSETPKTSLSISNSKIGSAGNPFKLNAEYTTNSATNDSSLGVLVGWLNNANMEVDQVSTYGNISTCSNFNNVGGIVGKATKSTITMGSDSSSPSQLNMTINACSNNHTYTGGIVGYINNSTLNINSAVSIGNKKAVTISADVCSSVYNAYAGGVAGGCNGSTISFKNNALVTIGNNGSGSYQDVSYILAGYLKSNAKAFPNNSNASILVGYNNNGTINNENIKIVNCITKYILRDESASTDTSINNISITSVGDEIDQDNAILNKLFKPSDAENITNKFEANYVKSIDLFIENEEESKNNPYTAKFINNKDESTPLELTSKYVEKNNTKEAYAYSLGIFDQLETLAYSAQKGTGKIISSDGTGVNVHEWLLNVTYTKNVKQCCNEEKNLDGSYSYTLTYQYKVVLSMLEQDIYDGYAISVEVIQLNDYIVNKTKIGDIQVYKEDILQYSREVFKETKEEIKNYNKTIISLSYNIKDIQSGITYSLAKDIFNPKMFSTSPVETDQSENNKITTTLYDGTLDINSWVIKLKGVSGKLSFSLSQSIQSDAEKIVTKAEYDEDSLTNGNTSAETNRENAIYKYNLSLIKQENVAYGDKSTTKRVMTNPNSKYGVELKYDGTTEELSKDVTYTKNQTVCDTIVIDYYAPTYKLADLDGISDSEFGKLTEFSKVDVLSMNHNNGNKYTIISCKDSNTYKDYIYLEKDGKYYSCGYITYTLGDKTSSTGSRYDSFFPVISTTEEGSAQISNIASKLTVPSTTPSTISLYVCYYDAKATITARQGDFHYEYTVVHTQYKQKIEISSSGITLGTDKIATGKQLSSSGVARVNGTSALNGLLTATQIEQDTTSSGQQQVGKYRVYEKTEESSALPGGISNYPQSYKRLWVYYDGSNYIAIAYTKEETIGEQQVTKYYYLFDNKEEEDKTMQQENSFSFHKISGINTDNYTVKAQTTD